MGTPRMCPARPCSARGCFFRKPYPSRSMINLSMKDLYFWVISSTYSSIFAKTKARFFAFKNLQATNELKVTKYLGFYHIGGWFSPTFASQKFHVPLAEKWCWVMGWSQVTQNALTKSCWVLASSHYFGAQIIFFLMVYRFEIKGKQSKVWKNLWTLELCLFGQDLLIVAPPTSYFHGDHSHISPQISADQSTRHLEIMEFQASCASLPEGTDHQVLFWSYQMTCSADLRKETSLDWCLRCVKWLRKCHDCSTAPETRGWGDVK